MKENPSNPFVRKDVPQVLAWSDLRDNSKYCLEILDPMHAVVEELGLFGKYLICAAEVIESSADPMMFQGKLIIVSFPIRTFEHVWFALPSDVRNNLDCEHNVRLKFKKETRRKIKILEYALKVASPEHLAFAKFQYERVQKEVDEFRQYLRSGRDGREYDTNPKTTAQP